MTGETVERAMEMQKGGGRKVKGCSWKWNSGASKVLKEGSNSNKITEYCINIWRVIKTHGEQGQEQGERKFPNEEVRHRNVADKLLQSNPLKEGLQK